jgi:hypothetical protein
MSSNKLDYEDESDGVDSDDAYDSDFNEQSEHFNKLIIEKFVRDDE